MNDNSSEQDLAPAAEMSAIQATSSDVGEASNEEEKARTREGNPSVEDQLEMANKESQSLREWIFLLEELLKSKSFDEDAFKNNDEKVSEKKNC